MRRLSVAILFVAITGDAALAQPATYTPVPPGFDFPADGAELEKALREGDETRLRTHGWFVFAGLTQPARPADPKSEALWETWFTGAEVFHAGPAPQAARTIRRNLQPPRQFAVPGPNPQAVGASQLAFTLFNEETRQHTRSHNLHLGSQMRSINAAWPSSTPAADRKVPDYPAMAMSLKTTWMPVKKTGLTPLPIWDEQEPSPNAPAQPERNWKRRVAVDPTRTIVPVGETTNFPQFPNSHVVPLEAFYHFTMTEPEAAAFRRNGHPDITAGDYAVLVAMHYTTKEIPNWVWATFWWHDRPEVGAFAKHRPDSTKLKNPWRNYLMDVAYDMDKPQESDGTPNAAFNPWLEAGFTNGVNSNCMTCHQRAVWSESSPVPSFLPITRGPAPDDDPIFRNGTKADFLWSLLIEGNQ